MFRTLFATVAMAAALTFAPIGSERAEALGPLSSVAAKPASDLQQAGFRHRHWRYHWRPNHVRWWRPYKFAYYNYRPRVFLYAAPYVSYRYAYHDGCAWLKRKYHETGNRRWWHRYCDCRGW